MRFLFAIPLAAAFIACGCASAKRTSIDYVDDDGRRATVEFAYGDGDTVKTRFRNARGEEQDFVSDKRISVTLSTGESFSAHQTMSEVGTMYVSRDSEWMCVSLGLFCYISRMLPDKSGHAMYFAGQAVEGAREKSSREGSHFHWGDGSGTSNAPRRNATLK